MAAKHLMDDDDDWQNDMLMKQVRKNVTVSAEDDLDEDDELDGEELSESEDEEDTYEEEVSPTQYRGIQASENAPKKHSTDHIKQYQFKPGNEATKLREEKRAAKKAAIAALDPANNWTRPEKEMDIREIRILAKTKGMSRIWAIMDKMNDADYFKAYVLMAPYLLPRVNSVDVKQSDDLIAGKAVKKAGHTITVKDMTKGTRKTIQDE